MKEKLKYFSMHTTSTRVQILYEVVYILLRTNALNLFFSQFLVSNSADGVL